MFQQEKGIVSLENQGECIAMKNIRRIVKINEELKLVLFNNVVQHFEDYVWLREGEIYAVSNEYVKNMNEY